jgi:hypothetical protein
MLVKLVYAIVGTKRSQNRRELGNDSLGTFVQREDVDANHERQCIHCLYSTTMKR